MKLFFHLATIEAKYEISATASTRQGAIHLVKRAYKKFYGQDYPYKDDDSIRVVCMEIGQAYVDGTELKNQKY